MTTLFVLALLCAAGEPTAAPNPVADIKNQLVYVNIGFGEGFGGISVSRAGEKLDLGFFGGNAATYFGASPAAMEQIESFASLRTTGFVMWTAGMAALIADVAFLSYIITSSESDFERSRRYDDNEGLVWGLLLGGAALGIPGGFMFQHANSKLTRAVNIFNAETLNKHLPEQDRIDLKIFLTQSGPAAGVVVHF